MDRRKSGRGSHRYGVTSENESGEQLGGKSASLGMSVGTSVWEYL